MYKENLLAMQPLNATEEMRKIEREDIPRKVSGWYAAPRKYSLFARCWVENGILKVALFSPDALRTGGFLPSYEVFIDRAAKKFITYDRMEDRWREAKVHQGLDVHRALAGLAVGDGHARLHNIAHTHLPGEPGVDHLDVHIVLSDLTALKPRALHIHDDGQHSCDDLKVINGPVAIAEKGPGFAVQGAQHPLGGFAPAEPVVDVVGQQAGFLLEHLLVVPPGDAQVGPHLAVGRLLDVQRLRLIHAAVQYPEHGLAARGVHFQRAGVHQEVLLGPSLTLDLLCHLSDGQSGFHLPHPLTRKRRCGRPGRQWSALPDSARPPAGANRPYRGNW